LLKIPPHLKRVATLPCEICLQEIIMLKNCVNKLPRETQTAIQDSAAENCNRKNTCLTMSALCNSLTRRYLLSNPHYNWMHEAAATDKKDFATKSFRTSSTFSQSL